MTIIRKDRIYDRYFMLSVLSFFVILIFFFSFISHFFDFQTALAKKQHRHQLQKESDKATTATKLSGDIINNTGTSGYLTYQNKEYGFSLQFPANYWKIKDNTYYSAVEFSKLLAPQMSSSEDKQNNNEQSVEFSVNASRIAPILDVNTLKLRSRNLDEYTNYEIKNMHSIFDYTNDFKILKVNRTYAIGTSNNKVPASRIDFTDSSYLVGSLRQYYAIYIFAIKNGYAYEFAYSSAPLQVPETFPIVLKMINSIQFFPPQPSSASNTH
jgi:hypothetical protein